MAALKEIAAAYTDEIRDGIAWVIIWKTGRSWHAEAIWLNPETGKVEPEDKAKVNEILGQDSKAVMVNGYYCGHFGEGMTVKEIEAGIRWHYENGICLKDSDVMEPEQESEEPQEHLELPGRRISRQVKTADRIRKNVMPVDGITCKKGSISCREILKSCLRTGREPPKRIQSKMLGRSRQFHAII